jgi:hypothetical protein
MLAGLLVLVALTMLLALFIGRYPRPIWMPLDLLWDDQMAQRLVLNLRLPRILSAFSSAPACRQPASCCRWSFAIRSSARGSWASPRGRASALPWPSSSLAALAGWWKGWR